MEKINEIEKNIKQYELNINQYELEQYELARERFLDPPPGPPSPRPSFSPQFMQFIFNTWIKLVMWPQCPAP